MPKLAQINVALMKAPIDSPLLADFAAQLDTVNAHAESSNGFLWRLKDDTGNATTISASSPFGSNMLVNLSTWETPDSLIAFVYRNNNHADALRTREKWFEKMPSPHFAMWWLADDEVPNLIDAKRRLEYLQENGDSPYAFTFKRTFEPSLSIVDLKHSKYLLRIADEALIHSQRLSEWCGHGPLLEEDIALGNVALDYLGQARLLFSHVAQTEGRSRDEDDLAYLRNEHEFFNATLVELPNSSAFAQRDYAVPIAKLFLHAAFMRLKWAGLARSLDTQLAAVAAKSIKECTYHFDHACQWILRFGDGTHESHDRIDAALTYLMPYTNEWFVDDEIDEHASAKHIGQLNAPMYDDWIKLIEPVLTEATLTLPARSGFLSRGRLGEHSEYLSLLLAEMQSLARQHPGVKW
jgi:ring-1,2-phenylacetyl-CoA epoxidase subunit PaaC